MTEYGKNMFWQFTHKLLDQFFVTSLQKEQRLALEEDIKVKNFSNIFMVSKYSSYLTQVVCLIDTRITFI